MQIDYDVGDWIVKTVDSEYAPKGYIAMCSGFCDDGDGVGLRLFINGQRIDDPSDGGWDPKSWKKLPKASDEFTEQMRKLKPHKQKVDA